MTSPKRSEPAEIVLQARMHVAETQAQFAKRFGRSQGMFSRYEKGTTRVPDEVLMQCMHIAPSRREPLDAPIEQLVAAAKEHLSDPQYAAVRKALRSLIEAIGASKTPPP